MLAARQADFRPLPRLVGLPPRDAQAQAAGDVGDILDLQGNQFRSANAAAKPNSSRARSRRPRAVRSQLASSRRSMARLSAAAFRTGAQGYAAPAQRFLDGAMRRVPRQIVEAMQLADRRETAADRGRRVALGEAGKVGADHGGFGGNRDEAGGGHQWEKCCQSAL